MAKTLNDSSRYVNDTCSHDLPYFNDIIDRIRVSGVATAELVVFIVAPLVVLTTMIIFIEQLVRTNLRSFPSLYRMKIVIILATSPTLALACLLSVIIPRSLVIVIIIIHVYTAFAVHLYIKLIEIGWSASEYDWTKAADLPVNGQPFCLLICLPTLTMSKSRYSLFRWLALQSIIIRPLTAILVAILWTNGNYTPGGEPSWINVLVQVIIGLSSLTSMYGINRTDAFHRGNRSDCYFPVRCIHVTQLLVVIVPLTAICSILVRAEALPCLPPLSSVSRGDRLAVMLFMVLLVPLGVLGRFMYLKTGGTGGMAFTYQKSSSENGDTNRQLQENIPTMAGATYDNEGLVVEVDNEGGTATDGCVRSDKVYL